MVGSIKGKNRVPSESESHVVGGIKDTIFNKVTIEDTRLQQGKEQGHSENGKIGEGGEKEVRADLHILQPCHARLTVSANTW